MFSLWIAKLHSNMQVKDTMCLQKKFSIFLCVIIMCFSFCSCVGPDAQKYHPTNFPDTIWATEDDSVVIEVSDELYHRGYININGKTYQLFFEMRNTGLSVVVYNNKQLVANYPTPIESWIVKSYEEEKMVVKTEASKYFNDGVTLTFYKKGANTSNDNYITANEAKKHAKKYLPKKEFEQHIRYNHIEKINGVDYHVLYSFAQTLENIGTDSSTYIVVSEEKICWIYLEATTGKLYNLEELEHKKITPPTFKKNSKA